MNAPITHDVSTQVSTLPTSTQTCSSSSSAEQGQQAAQDIVEQFEPLRGFPSEVYYHREYYTDGLEGSGLYKWVEADMSDALQRAQEDPEFAAAFFNELGPETTAAFFANYESLIYNEGTGRGFDDRWNLSAEDGTALLQDFSAALGAASSNTNGCFDGATFVREMTGAQLQVNGSDLPFDPELAAIIVSNGDFSPEAAAELGAYVLLNDDPPGAEPIDTYPAHREALFTPYSGAPETANNAWATAIRGVMANGASSEVLNVDGVAERLVDPDLMTSSVDGTPRVNETPALVGALLEQPVTDLRNDSGDQAAIGAVEELVLAGKQFHGRVNEDGANAFGALYTAFAPEILNAGEGASAFPLARNSELGRYLADSGPLQAGDGSFSLTAALTATGTPPLDPQSVSGHPLDPSTERFDSWSDALTFATAEYRNEVEAHGPPIKDASGGGTYPDLNALATEIADIDGEFLTGVYGAEAIAAADVDDANAFKQQVFNILTDYAGYAVGLGPAGASLSGAATLYNTHMEGAILEQFFPTDNAQGVFNATVPEQQQQLLAAQTVRLVDSAGQSGAVELPESLVDSQTGGLRMPEPGADADQFAADLAEFITTTPALHEAVDLARAQLEERTNALDAGQYRGG